MPFDSFLDIIIDPIVEQVDKFKSKDDTPEDIKKLREELERKKLKRQLKEEEVKNENNRKMV